MAQEITNPDPEKWAPIIVSEIFPAVKPPRLPVLPATHVESCKQELEEVVRIAELISGGARREDCETIGKAATRNNRVARWRRLSTCHNRISEYLAFLDKYEANKDSDLPEYALRDIRRLLRNENCTIRTGGFSEHLCALTVVSPPITIRHPGKKKSIMLPPMLIEFPFNTGAPSIREYDRHDHIDLERYMVFRMFKKKHARSGSLHPHGDGEGSMCWGDWRTLICQPLHQGLLGQAFEVMVQALSSSPDPAHYNYFDRFFNDERARLNVANNRNRTTRRLPFPTGHNRTWAHQMKVEFTTADGPVFKE